MRRLIIDVAIYLGINAVAQIAIDIADAPHSWRESTMFWAGALAGWIVMGWREDAERREQEKQRHD